MSVPHQGTIMYYGKFLFSTVRFLHLQNFVTTTSHNFLKSGLSKSSVSVLTLTVFCIYTRLQIHVSVPGGIGNYFHIGIQVDTDNLITYHFLENL